MQDFSNKKILLGLCGGVAAYKSAYLLRELKRLGAQVRVVMTQSAQQFISPLLMQALSAEEVRTEVFDPQAERAMGHIELARWADLVLIAPASANFLAKMAHGLADDLLSTLCLVTQSPVLVCPAMNQSMWSHPATQANYELLKQRGLIFIGPDSGDQACGEQGFGRMSEVNQILNALNLYPVHQLLAGQRVLITAGPTREAIDPVRYLSNYSSGKMGYALAEAAAMAGAEVTLIAGPNSLKNTPNIRLIRVESAQAMLDEVMKSLERGMIFISAAAVADYRIKEPAAHKIKKTKQEVLHLELVKNPDILAAVVEQKTAAFVVGFAAETEEVLTHAKEKFLRKKLDMLIANQVGPGLGFESDVNQVTVLTKKAQFELALASKSWLAGAIIRLIAEALAKEDHVR